MRDLRGLSLFLAEDLGWILFLQCETYNVEVLDMMMGEGNKALSSHEPVPKNFTPLRSPKNSSNRLEKAR